MGCMIEHYKSLIIKEEEMGYMKFNIKCKQCGHVNMPNNNTRKGIFQTLTGEFSMCRSCGKQWNTVGVPLRPLVREIIQKIQEEGPRFSEHVQVYEYTGRTPRAIAA